MKFILIILVTSILLAVENCSGDKKSKESLSNSNEFSSVIANLGIKNAEKFSGKLDELLTLEIAAKVTQNDLNGAEKDYNTFFDDPKTHEVSYRWQNGRKMTRDLGFTTIEMDKADLVQLSWVSVMSASDFKDMYKEITAEDIARAKKAMEENVNQGNLDSETKKLAMEMATGFMERDNSREWLEGVGDMAVWIASDNSLKVFYQGLTFSITADVSDDKNINKKTAVDISKTIIQEKL